MQDGGGRHFEKSDKTGSSFGGQTVVDTSICSIKVEWEVGYREFVYAVSTIFLLPVWPEMAVGGLFSTVMHALRCHK